MLSRQIYPLIIVFLFNAVCLGTEYKITVSSNRSPEYKSHHWRHHTTNSAIDIKGIEVDIFQWRVAAKSRESVHIEILNPIWEFAGWANDYFVLPAIIEISNPLNYKGTPTVYIKVTPWRIMGNGVEVLTHGEIQISVNPVDFPITFDHPYLLNGKKRSLKREFSPNTQYLIICPSLFSTAAKSLADMHMNEVNEAYRLKTKVVFTDSISTSISGEKIRNYILDRINNDLKFLLLFGNEIDIPPIYNDNGDYISDDFYTTPENDNIFNGDPQLYSGRIPISTKEEADIVVEKIREYTLTPTPGIWRSKVALVADDMYRTCSLDSGESSHTENSDEIYDYLTTLLPVQPFYGVHYGLQHTGSGCTYPDLTGDLIRTINNGVALVNYIGHGDPETWADEKLISKSRDLPLIQVDNNKLAIWVAGTCSFGKYNDENSFMEALLFKEDGAIAFVATTDAIGYAENSNYLNNLFGLTDTLGIQHIIKKGYDIRLGELTLNAKNGNYHKFHTFGDPAMHLPFPSISDEIITNPPDYIPLIEEVTISFGKTSKNSSLLIRGNDKEITYDYGSDSLVYNIPGTTYSQINFTGSKGCFRIPLDAGSCDSCSTDIHLYQDNNGSNGRIQFIPDIPIRNSDDSFHDTVGPDIQIFQDDYSIMEGSILLPNIDLTINLKDDSSGINLMETIGHGIRYAYDYDDENLILVPGSEFIYENCSDGSVNIPVPNTLSNGYHRFYLEAWDGVNNKSTIDINLEILDNPQQTQLLLSKVYPFPNPFSKNTHFTMFVSDTPAKITITVYSLMGEKVRVLEDEANKPFKSIEWDGKDETGHKIANGAYFYHVKAEKDGKDIFEDIFKLAKVE